VGPVAVCAQHAVAVAKTVVALAPERYAGVSPSSS
jgi:hypothetical protein